MWQCLYEKGHTFNFKLQATEKHNIDVEISVNFNELYNFGLELHGIHTLFEVIIL